ncbi:MAG TPA: zf-HC2 domain-containing protein, partial [candidate division Zixibacteria bacterium]|nr:zf-HC2 domain-containing protein [candidate division Zixibacteria bacterium]
MNCQEALNLLYDIIDKEASEIDTRQVREHLERCSDCFEKYRLQTEIQNFLNEKIRHGQVEVAHERLKSRILDRLDALDGAGEAADRGHTKARGNPRPFRRAAISLMAAAAALILIGAGMLGVRLYSHQTKFAPLQQAHVNLAAAVREGGSYDAARAAAGAREKFGYQIRPAVGEFHLIAGRSETIMGEQMLHFVYALDRQTVSVFLAPAAWFAQVNDGRLSEVVRDNVRFFDHNCRG